MMRRRLGLLVAALAATAALGGVGNGSIGGPGSAVGGGTITAGAIGGPSSSVDTVTFDLNPDGAAIASGPGNLSDSLTVNGTAMTIVASYDARDVSGTSWVARAGVAGTLAEAGSGTSPSSGQAAPFTETAARGVKIAGSSAKYYDGTSTSFGTLDYAYEIVFKWGKTGFTETLVSDYDGTNGWRMQIASSGAVSFDHKDGSLASAAGGTVVDGAWYHAICFGDRSVNLRCALDGVGVAAISIAARTASVTSTAGLEIGADSLSPTTSTGSTVAFFRAWTCTACLNTSNAAATDAVAFARMRQLEGTYPAIALGTATPSTATRASTATIDIDRDGDGVVRYFTVGNNWLRTARRKDANSVYMEGTRVEPQSTNLALQSNALDTTWTPADGAITANARADAFGDTVLDSYESTDAAGDVAHCDDQAITLTAATYTASAVYYRSEAVGFALMEDSTIANGKAWFNLSTCDVGTKQAGVARSSATILSSTLCRVSMSFTGTVAAHTIRLCGATADNVATYDDGTNATADWTAGTVQVEQRASRTSPIPTTTASVTRSADDLRFSSTSHYPAAAPVTIEASVLLNDFADTAVERRAFGCGADATNENYIRIEAGANNIFGARGYATSSLQWDIDGTTDVTSNIIATARVTANTNAITQYVNGASQGTPDASATVPVTSIGSCFIGERANGTTQLDGIIGRARIWSSVVAP